MNKHKLTPGIRKYIDSISKTLPTVPVLIPNPEGVLFIQRTNGKPRLMNHNVNLTQGYLKIGEKCFNEYNEYIYKIQTILKNDKSSE